MEINSQSPRNKEDSKDPEFLMDSAGSWSRYQGFQTTCFVLVVVFYTYGHYLPILYLYTPEHHCFIPGGEDWNLTQGELKHLFIPKVENESLFEKCLMYDVNVSQVLGNGASEPDPSWSVRKCSHGWNYEVEGYFNSVSSEFDFVCDDAWKGPFTDTFYFIGSAIGMLLNGWVGDLYGRYWSIVICTCSMCLSGFILGFSTNYIFFIVIRFFMGIFCITGMTSFFVLTMEYVSKDKRTVIGNFSLSFGIFLAGFIMPGLFYALEDWRLVNHALFGQGLLIVFIPFTTHESIRWLLERGDYEKTTKILSQVAKFNGKNLDKNIITNLNSANIINTHRSIDENKNKEVTSVFALIKTPRLRRNFLNMLLIWSLITILFESQLRGIKTLDVHIYLSFVISNVLELPAGVIIIWTMEWFGRRWNLMYSSFLSSIVMFIFAYIVESTNDDIGLLVLSMLGRFASSMAINVGMQFQFEICPTDLRSRGSGIILFSGGLSAFLAPYIIHSARVYEILPQLIMGAIGIAIGLLCLALPETASIELPANVKEAQEFGVNDNFFYVPILKNKEKKRTN